MDTDKEVKNQELVNKLLHTEFNSPEWHNCYQEIINNALGINLESLSSDSKASENSK
jgi:hypothetical protein